MAQLRLRVKRARRRATKSTVRLTSTQPAAGTAGLAANRVWCPRSFHRVNVEGFGASVGVEELDRVWRRCGRCGRTGSRRDRVNDGARFVHDRLELAGWQSRTRGAAQGG